MLIFYCLLKVMSQESMLYRGEIIIRRGTYVMTGQISYVFEQKASNLVSVLFSFQ